MDEVLKVWQTFYNKIVSIFLRDTENKSGFIIFLQFDLQFKRYIKVCCRGKIIRVFIFEYLKIEPFVFRVLVLLSLSGACLCLGVIKTR